MSLPIIILHLKVTEIALRIYQNVQLNLENTSYSLGWKYILHFRMQVS